MIDYTYAIEVKNSVSFVEWIRHNARLPRHRHGDAGASGQQKRCNMQVFIMRHGDAALDAASDSVRPLTVCGCDESRQMATWLKGQKVDIERVLVSPYLRAEQTLDIVGECMNLPKHVDVMPELTPCGDVGMVSAYLQALANEGVATALVVSHLPLVGYLVSELCPGETPPMFTTSAIACVTLDADGKGEFLWQKSPCNLKMANAI